MTPVCKVSRELESIKKLSASTTVAIVLRRVTSDRLLPLAEAANYRFIHLNFDFYREHMARFA